MKRQPQRPRVTLSATALEAIGARDYGQVLVDTDVDPVELQNLSGAAVSADHRVLVVFDPPQGAYIAARVA